jgi:hypothetical protein
MIKLETNKMQKAIERAKAIRPRVRWNGGREFTVTGSKGDSYKVRFAVAGGHKLGECDCKAGKAGQMCFHLAAAASLNIAIQSMRVSSPIPAPAPVPARKPADWMGKRSGNAMVIDGWAV